MNASAVIEHEPQQQVVLRAASPMDVAPAEFRSALARRGENRKSLIDWIRSSLVDGVDFGAIQRRNGSMTKPSLRKPGAEKICGMLGVTAVFPTLKDYEAAALDGRDIRNIILRCHILAADGQTVVADGVGARNLESDNGDLNKALKMALKSAHIDATLRMAGLSEIFTQDLEDMPPAAIDGQNSDAPRQQAHQQASNQRPQAQASRSNGGRGFATERQVKLLRVKLDQSGIPESDYLHKFEVENLEQTPFNRVNEALAWIDGING